MRCGVNKFPAVFCKGPQCPGVRDSFASSVLSISIYLKTDLRRAYCVTSFIWLPACPKCVPARCAPPKRIFSLKQNKEMVEAPSKNNFALKCV